jgi:ribonuclease P protein component
VGRRVSRPLLTVHLLPADPAGHAARHRARAGLVVSKAVGGSVLRHRTSRRLRALLLPQAGAARPGDAAGRPGGAGIGSVPSARWPETSTPR